MQTKTWKKNHLNSTLDLYHVDQGIIALPTLSKDIFL